MKKARRGRAGEQVVHPWHREQRSWRPFVTSRPQATLPSGPVRCISRSIARYTTTSARWVRPATRQPADIMRDEPRVYFNMRPYFGSYLNALAEIGYDPPWTLTRLTGPWSWPSSAKRQVAPLGEHPKPATKDRLKTGHQG